MIDNEFSGGFVERFKKASSAAGRRKRNTENATTTAGPTTESVEVDTVILTSKKANTTTLKSAIENASNLTAKPGSIIGMTKITATMYRLRRIGYLIWYKCCV